MDPAVFLDKDGTLIEDVPYSVDPNRIRWTPRAPQGLRRLAQAGYRFFVVSNQSGVALGYFCEQDLCAVERRLREILEEEGLELADFLYCPHHPRGTVAEYARACECRKPAPGMIERAAREHGVDLGRSWMIGDILDDVEAGRRAGCRTVLLDTGAETEWRGGPLRSPDITAMDLYDAAGQILAAASTGTATAGKMHQGDYE